MAIENEGGYDFEFVDQLKEGQKCSICLVAMRDTVQTLCGHRYCENCLLRTFRESNERICPQDRNRIPEKEGIFRDVGWDRDILSLRVKCKKSSRGCTWIGGLRNHEKHLTVCLNEDVFCKDCDEVMQRMDLDPHMTFECPKRKVQCDYCDKLFAYCNIQDHEDNECARFPMDCPQKCLVKKIPREELACHVQGDCSMTVVICPYQGIGCIFYDNRYKLKDHIKESTEHHLRKSSIELDRLRQELDQMKGLQRSVEKLQMENESMRRFLKISDDEHHMENEMLRKEIKRLSTKVEELEEFKENVEEMNNVFEAMGDVLNRRKETKQTVTRNKRKKEHEVVRIPHVLKRKKAVNPFSSHDADESPDETVCFT